jgi:hypothetical protein
MITGQQISKELCAALGLPKYTRGFTLRCYTDEIVTVECEYYPDGSFQTELARYRLTPSEGSAAARFDFDGWMRDRVGRAHREYMERTSRLPPCAPLVYPPDQIAKFYGISHGGID